MSSPEDTEPVELLDTLLERVGQRIEDERDHLTELDSKIGDADFGMNLHRGCQSALDAVEALEDPSPTEFVSTIGETLLEEMAGSSGIIFGRSLMVASEELDEELSVDSVAAFAEAFRETVEDLGEVDVGAKTMYDVVVPVTHALRASTNTEEHGPLQSSARAVEAARRGAMFTTALRAKRGRASYTEWRSVGNPDPGAVGTYMILSVIHEVLEDEVGERCSPGFDDEFDS
ncbi:dihydroxyacetone kinase subunit DhaL [Halomicroarcula sp. GCM10025817]|uniref:dihydroxyacetone kinase subunit DhaL n=1 Tax=Haloarcula TaxID=2237 RepID=UPI0023E78469|nr:dihydroxyacetone kinase subunit DhaL [Halomicroarcula sp. SYNS111]